MRAHRCAPQLECQRVAGERDRLQRAVERRLPSIATLSEAEHTTEVLVRATHPLHHWEESDLADAFQSIVVGLIPILGDPHQLSESGACWEARTGGRIWVKRLSTAASIILLVLSPEYAETERLEELALAG